MEIIKGKAKSLNMSMQQLSGEIFLDIASLYKYSANKFLSDGILMKHLKTALQMDGEEAWELEEALRAEAFGDERMRSWQLIDKYIFDGHRYEIEDYQISCQDDGHSQSADSLFESVFREESENGYQCHVDIVNCLSPSVLPKLMLFLKKAACFKDNIQTIHLADMQAQRIDLLIESFLLTIFDLSELKLKGYSLFARFDTPDDGLRFLDDTVIVSIAKPEDPAAKAKHFVLKLSQADDSVFMTLSEPALGFLRENFFAYKREFNLQLYRKSDFGTAIQENKHNEKISDKSVLLKSDPCYNEIPPEVYLSLKERMIDSLSADSMLFFAEMSPGCDLTEAVETVLEEERRRYEMTFMNETLSVYSKDGLRKFYATGRSNDYISSFLPFTKSEVAQIFRTHLKRSLDPKDKFSMRITHMPLMKDKSLLKVYSSGYIYFERLEGEFKQPIDDQAVFLSKKLSSALLDYVQNWLIPKYAISMEEAQLFINSLTSEESAND
jgi:hypothetical protein